MIEAWSSVLAESYPGSLPVAGRVMPVVFRGQRMSRISACFSENNPAFYGKDAQSRQRRQIRRSLPRNHASKEALQDSRMK